MSQSIQPFVYPIAQYLNRYEIVTWIILGFLGFWAIRWQYQLLVHDVNRIHLHVRRKVRDPRKYLPSRVRGTISICLLIAMGVLVKAVISTYVQDTTVFPTEELLATLVLLLPFFVIFSIKSYFGPLVTVGMLAVIVYNLAYRQAIIVPEAVEAIFELTISLLPEPIEEFYAIFYVVYALATSWHDTQEVSVV